MAEGKPLEIHNVYGGNTLWVKGHVDRLAFIREFRREFPGEPITCSEIRHEWWRNVPVPKDDPDRRLFSYWIYPARPGSRGAYPVTCTGDEIS